MSSECEPTLSLVPSEGEAANRRLSRYTSLPRGCEVWSAATKSFLGDLFRAMRMSTC